MKLGCLPYLNVKPLVYNFEHGGLPRGWELVYAPPSRLAEMLKEGEIAAAPVSSFACFENPELETCPGICIAADGPVQSVLMLSRKSVAEGERGSRRALHRRKDVAREDPRPPGIVSTVALDTSSLSGANMLKIILEESYGLHPEYVNMPPEPVSAMLERCDAALVIGNPAMLYPKDGLFVLDVAEEWKKLTGLPAVFAMWAGRKMTDELIDALRDAKQQGTAKIPDIALEESTRLGMPFDTCFEYLSRTMIYDLGERESRGLEVFRKKCARLASDSACSGIRDPQIAPFGPDQRSARTDGGERLSAEDALMLLANASLPKLARAAERVCDAKHPSGVKTYVVDRNINYTNICVSGCAFCAFFRPPGHPEGYVLSTDQIIDKIQEAVGLGATQILMQGGLHPDLKIDHFETLFREIKARFDIRLHSLSAPEVVHIAGVSGLSVAETLRRLREAGLDSLPGGGAEMLVDEVRARVSPRKCGAAEWIEVMRTASSIGMRATATMVFGMGESLRDRAAHMAKIRDLQDQTGVFTAFIPWTYQSGNTALGGRPVGGHDYLRTLAVSRLFLDNIENIQASWVTQGGKIAQLALRFGANDIGSTMIEENVVAAAGVSHTMDESALIALIHDAGFDAAQRSVATGAS